MNNPTKKYNFKIEIDQFGNSFQNQDFYDKSEEILIQKFEKVAEIIKSYNQNQYSMVELGCNQCFYSIFFHSIIGKDNTKIILVEPYKPFLQRGLRNLSINNLDIEIVNKCVGKKKWIGQSPDYEFDVDLISLKELIEDSDIDFLHCDIDGSEIEMLHENRDVFLSSRFKVIFILTHDVDSDVSTHQNTKDFFSFTDYRLIYECDKPIIGSDSLLIYTVDDKIDIK